MGKKFLFSPIGLTDPIKYCYDGSMLHICRHFLPDVVYLFLSEEMLDNHRKDNRYVLSIKKLEEHTGHPFDIRIIETNMTDVHQYDVFYKEFREQIKKIVKEMSSEDELILNMSSGTPAMKSSLLLLSTLNDYRYKAIQVSTPEQHSNKEPYLESAGIDDLWETNIDNEPSAQNRCEEVRCIHLETLLKIDVIKRHIQVYDYTAAVNIANDLKGIISEEAFNLIKLAEERSKLNRNEVDKIVNKLKSETVSVLGLLPDTGKRKIFEYALLMDAKRKRQEYTDFIKGMTPLLFEILLLILKQKCDCDIEKITEIRPIDGALVWSKEKLDNNPSVRDILDREYNYNFKLDHPVNSDSLNKLIEAYCRDRTITKMASSLREGVEKNIRNDAAHKIVPITDEAIKNKTQFNSKQIMDMFKELMEKTGIVARKDDWNAYDNMNKKIILLLGE